MIHFKKKTLVLAIASNLSAVAPAMAENGANDETIKLDGVMVTGEKIARPEEKTLSSVEVVTSEEIREHGDTNLQDIMERTPGVYSQSGNENWGIRGVPVSGFDDQGPAAINGAVSIYVDDAIQVHRMSTFNSLQLWDVEQVEVYRGSQSTTQGRNSLAGAVVLKTKNPTFNPEFTVQANIGKYGEQGGSAVANGAIIEGLVAGRLAVDYQTSDGYIENTTLDKDANPLKAANVRGKLLIQPSDDVDLLLTLARTEHSTGINAVAAEDGEPIYYQLFENTETDSEITQDTATAKLDIYLNDSWTLTSITSGTWSDYDSVLDFDQNSTTTEEVFRHHEQELASQELRFGYGSERLSGVIGVYVGVFKSEVDDQLIFQDFDLEVLDQEAEVDIDNRAVFGELNWSFVEDWQLITGLRYDHEENSTKIEYPTNLAGGTPAEEEDTSDVLLPKVGVSHQLSEDHLVGVVWQRGYRSGGVNLRALGLPTTYDPEFTSTIELSWRGSWLNKKLRTSANVYHTDWKDQQVTFMDDDGNRQVTNASESRMQGLEFSADYQATPSLGITAGFAYNNTEYQEFIQNTSDLSGQDFLYAPEFMASVGANYTFANGLLIGGDVVYQGDSVSAYETDADGNVTGERRNDEVTLVNLNAEYPVVESFIVSGYVKNLFDEEYITNNQSDTLLDVGAPLTLGVAARYTF